jgi:Tol biopolymer transport system component
VYTTLVKGKPLLMRKAWAGGEPKQLSDDFADSADISPDGKYIAMVSVVGSGVQTKVVIKIIPAEGGAPIKVLDTNPLISGPIQYWEDGKAVVYPITEKGVSNLVKQSLDGGSPTQVTAFNDLISYGFAYNWPADKLAIARGKLNSDVVVITQQTAAQ